MDELEIAMLGTLSEDKLKEVLFRISEEERRKLAKSGDLKYCGKICYEVLAEDYDIEVRGELAHNPSLGEACGKECMLKLTNDPDYLVRWELARNSTLGEACGKECMLKLAEDPARLVRRELCRRKDLDKYCPECVQICGKI